MNFANRPVMSWMLSIVTIVILPATACGQTITPTNTPIIQTTNPNVGQDARDLPRVWLIVGDTQWVGTLAAGGTPQWHFDPALTLPDIRAPMLPAEAKLDIAIDSNSVQNFTVTVRPWNRDGTISPLIDSSARQLEIESHSIGNSTNIGHSTVITLEAIGNNDDQLLNVNVIFKDGWGFYLWRLNSQQ